MTARAGWHRERQRPDEPLVTFRLTDDAAIRSANGARRELGSRLPLMER